MMKRSTHERGSALFLILIAVMLFGALSYVVAQMIRGGNPEVVSSEKAGILADEIMTIGRQYRSGVQTMRISNGCDETEISFEATGLTGYAHTPAAPDSCKLFHPAGGSLPYSKPSAEFGSGVDWLFTGSNVAEGVGTSEPDLIAILPNINLAICNVINDRLNLPDAGNDTSIALTKFDGTYNNTDIMSFAVGLPAGCLNFVSGGNNYLFYQVLIAR